MTACVYGAFVLTLIAAAVHDVRTMTIPNRYVLTGVVLWGVYAIVGIATGEVFTEAIIAAVATIVSAAGVSGFLLMFTLAYEAITGKVGLGGGDIKLLFACNLFLGFPQGVINVVLACVLGVLYSVLTPNHGTMPLEKTAALKSSVKDLADHRGSRVVAAESAKVRVARVEPFPFGPAIAASTILLLLGGPMLPIT